MHTNMVGLEAEYLLRNKEGELVSPDDYRLSTDGFPLLGEVRGDPGKTRAETVANFFRGWYENLYEIALLDEALTVDLSGWGVVTPEVYAAAMRSLDTKEVARCKNIYGTDLLSLSNKITKRGVITSVVLTTGLHVHFSSQDTVKFTSPRLKSYDLPLKFGDATIKTLTLYEKVGDDREKVGEISRITKPVVRAFVEAFDKEILPNYSVKAASRFKDAMVYRQPGFYETKRYGFEYRSLPFTEQVLADLYKITDFAFTLLESL